MDQTSFDLIKVPTVTDVELRNDQIRATLYGQCVGDAIGLLTEFLTKKDAKKVYKHKNLEYGMKIGDFHRMRWETGDWTDDSDQMLLILLSLVDNKGQVNVQDFAEKLRNWMLHGIQELGDTGGMGIGATTQTVLKHPVFTEDPRKVAQECWENSGRDLAPNGGVMRTSVVGTHCWWDLRQVTDNAISFCACTHYDQRCKASVVAVSACISLMLQRQPRHMDSKGRYLADSLIIDSYEHAKQCLQTEEDRQLLWKYMTCTKIKELQLDEKGKIGYTYKSMGSGFWALKQDDFRTAIQKVVFQGGDADTNACVAGAMLACKLGLDKIPPTWKNGLKHKEWLDAHIQRWLTLQKDIVSNQLDSKDRSPQQLLAQF